MAYRCRAGWLLALAWALTASMSAQAAPTASDKAAAQALFDDGLREMKAGEPTRACVAFEESLRLDPAMGTRFQLAQCYEAVGRTASAWAAYLELADLARSSGQTNREVVARDRAAAVAPKLSHLVVSVATPSGEGFEVQRDNVTLGPAQWGVPIPIDPGTYEVTATAPSKQTWHGQVKVPGEGGTATLEVPPLLDLLVASPLAPAAPRPDSVLPPAPPAPPVRPTSHLQRELGIAATSVGVAAVGVGIGLGFVAKSEYDSVGDHCQGMTCDSSGLRTTSSARSLGDGATVLVGVGAALAAGGLVVWLTAKSSRSTPRTALHVGPRSVSADVTF